MRVAADSVQLALPDAALSDPVDRWWELPDATRAQVLALLARLIARGVLVEGTTAAEEREVAGDV
jgi:hypothetical protein